MSSRLVNGSSVVPLLTSQYLCALMKVVYQPSVVTPTYGAAAVGIRAVRGHAPESTSACGCG